MGTSDIDQVTTQVTENDLHGAVVMSCSIGQLAEIAEDIRRLIMTHRRVIDEQFEILKAYSDLYIELTDKSAERKWLDARIKRAEREAARIRLPIWFWRRTDDSVSLQLKARAAWMIEDRYLDDDIFDMLKEFLATIEEYRVTDKQLVAVIDSVRSEIGMGVADANPA